jgi:hypothetical protein
MTPDEAVGQFLPGFTFSAVHKALIRQGWNDKFAQADALRIMRLGQKGRTAFESDGENQKAFGPYLTTVINLVRNG